MIPNKWAIMNENGHIFAWADSFGAAEGRASKLADSAAGDIWVVEFHLAYVKKAKRTTWLEKINCP